MTPENRPARGSEKARRRIMANVELSSREAGLLEEILVRYYSDLRFEIADTDDKAFLKFLKSREAFMRSLITRLEKAEVDGMATP
jgi:hypothetical protein